MDRNDGRTPDATADNLADDEQTTTDPGNTQFAVDADLKTPDQVDMEEEER